MKNFLMNMISGTDGMVSVKRVIGMLGFLVLATAMFITSVSKHEMTPSIDLVEAVRDITAVALFGNVIEKFASSTTTTSNTQSGE